MNGVIGQPFPDQASLAELLADNENDHGKDNGNRNTEVQHQQHRPFGGAGERVVGHVQGRRRAKTGRRCKNPYQLALGPDRDRQRDSGQRGEMCAWMVLGEFVVLKVCA